jgi:hypothetical protein
MRWLKNLFDEACVHARKGYLKLDWDIIEEFEDPTVVCFESDELAWEVRPGFMTTTLVSVRKHLITL